LAGEADEVVGQRKRLRKYTSGQQTNHRAQDLQIEPDNFHNTAQFSRQSRVASPGLFCAKHLPLRVLASRAKALVKEPFPGLESGK
jgi:hypothetical protein